MVKRRRKHLGRLYADVGHSLKRKLAKAAEASGRTLVKELILIMDAWFRKQESEGLKT